MSRLRPRHWPAAIVVAALVGALLALPAAAARDETALVSRATGGAAADGASFVPSISADGRVVAFESAADNLSAEDVNTVENVFARDLLTGTTTLVSRASGAGGAAGAAGSVQPAVSGDGRFVAFDSAADNLSAEDNDALDDVFVRDLATGTTTLVSRASGPGGAGGDSGSADAAISRDGRFVAFDSAADNLSTEDDDDYRNVFVRDLLTGTTTLVSRASGPGGAGGDSGSFTPSISADGLFVSFDSTADNFSADANTTYVNVFVRDLVANTTTLVSRASGPRGAGGIDGSSGSSISAEGRFVAFSSAADNLSGEDDDSARSIFVRDLAANTTTLVSRADGPAGAGGDGGSYLPSISGGGRLVAFESFADNLSGEDDDEVPDIFVRDLVAGTTTLASRAPGAGGAGGDGASGVPVISANGRMVAFESESDNLSTEDDEFVTDVFARDITPLPEPPRAARPTGEPTRTGAAARCGGHEATLVGTQGRDVLRGTARRDVIAALGGADLVTGGGGSDLICLGAGADRGLGGPGNDRVVGGPGTDRLTGGLGADRLFGGAGRDVLSGGPGEDRLVGGAGRDVERS